MLHRPESDIFTLAEFVVVIIRRPSFDVQDVIVLKLAHGKEDHKNLHDCINCLSIVRDKTACFCRNVLGNGWMVTSTLYLAIKVSSLNFSVVHMWASHKQQLPSSWTKQMNLKCFKEKKPASEDERRKHFQKAHMEIMVLFCEFWRSEKLSQTSKGRVSDDNLANLWNFLLYIFLSSPRDSW